MVVWEKFKKTLFSCNLIRPVDRILLAVSGGPDSICLLHLFYRLRKRYPNLWLEVAYINHGLRPQEIENEIKLITDYKEKYELPFWERKINIKDTESLGLEASARKARYESLLRLAKIRNINKIATGHNLDDQVETIIFNLLRGSGPEGVVGMPINRELISGINLIRPLIKISRNEIKDYLNKNNLKYCNDSSNKLLIFTRNRIRHKLVPELEKINPGFKEHLVNLSYWSEIKERYFERIVNKIERELVSDNRQKKINLDLTQILKYNTYIQYKLLRSLLIKFGRQKVYSKVINQILYLISLGRNKNKKRVYTSKNLEIWL